MDGKFNVRGCYSSAADVDTAARQIGPTAEQRAMLRLKEVEPQH
jgi:hypothetical protein